jgi:hypothetical protein
VAVRSPASFSPTTSSQRRRIDVEVLFDRYLKE